MTVSDSAPGQVLKLVKKRDPGHLNKSVEIPKQLVNKRIAGGDKRTRIIEKLLLLSQVDGARTTTRHWVIETSHEI